MKKITRGQIIFLIAYPIIHGLSVALLWYAAVSIISFEEFEFDSTKTPSIVQISVWYALKLLCLPFDILSRLSILPPKFDNITVWIITILTGVLYGFVILFLYKLIRKR